MRVVAPRDHVPRLPEFEDLWILAAGASEAVTAAPLLAVFAVMASARNPGRRLWARPRASDYRGEFWEGQRYRAAA